MAKSISVDQEDARRFAAIARRVRSNEDVFRRQGAVVESWRSYRGRRLGPYYRLIYRDGPRILGIGIQICFDVNWHEQWRQLKEKGAQIVFFPSVYPAARAALKTATCSAACGSSPGGYNHHATFA